MHIAAEPASAVAATLALPTRRLQWPPAMQPRAPTAMTTKLRSATEAVGGVDAAVVVAVGVADEDGATVVGRAALVLVATVVDVVDDVVVVEFGLAKLNRGSVSFLV